MLESGFEDYEDGTSLASSTEPLNGKSNVFPLNEHQEPTIEKIIDEKLQEGFLRYIKKEENAYEESQLRLIYLLLRKHNPALFYVLIRNIIPKLEEHDICKLKLEKIEIKIEQLQADLRTVSEKVGGLKASLPFWERDEKWLILNKSLDWLLKAGLSVVPILSLFSIIGFRNLNNLSSGWNIGATVSVVFGVLLVWATSAAVYNWVISEEKNSSSDERHVTLINAQGLHWKVNKFRFLIFMVWLSEAVLGFAVIPNLIEISGEIAAQRLGQEFPGVSLLERLEILVGVSIFAYINIWFSVAKGRVYIFNSEKRIELGREISNQEWLSLQITKCSQQVNELRARITRLESEVNNAHVGSIDFVSRLDELSDLLTRGRNYGVTDVLLEDE